MNQIIVGIDPGDAICGLCVTIDGQIVDACNVQNDRFWDKVTKIMLSRNVTCIVEDIKPYSDRLRQQVIDTCKFIGELTYRLKTQVSCDCRLISRSEVRKWVFDRFPEICLPEINKKIAKKCFDASDVKTREQVRVFGNGRRPPKPYFVFVDDAIVKKCVTVYYKIPVPKPGDGYLYGLKDHSWQAAVLCAYFEEKLKTPDPLLPSLES